MRIQSEFIYAIIIFVLILSAIFLTYITINQNLYTNSLGYNYQSLNIITNYIKGFTTLDLQLVGYQESQTAGLNSYGVNYWISAPPSCNYPPSCSNAINYLQNIINESSESTLESSALDINIYGYYNPYNIEFNFSYLNESLPNDICSNIQNYYNGFYINVSNIIIQIYSPQSQGTILYNNIINISDDTALYLYNIASNWASTPQASEDILHDCYEYLKSINQLPPNVCPNEIPQGENAASALQNYFDNPNVICNEHIQLIGLIGQCPYQCNINSEYCEVNILCTDHQYNILYNGGSAPQEIEINGIVYANKITLCNYNITNYICNITKIVNDTNNEIINQYINCQYISSQTPNTCLQSCPSPSEQCSIILSNITTQNNITTYFYETNIEITNTTSETFTYLGIPCYSHECCPLPPQSNPPDLYTAEKICNIN